MYVFKRPYQVLNHLYKNGMVPLEYYDKDCGKKIKVDTYYNDP
jgi:hypothetical protein